MRIIIIIISLLLLFPLQTGAREKHALLVGISNYHISDKSNEWNDIHGVNDVLLITPVLKEQGFAIQFLTDADATHKNIITSLRQLPNNIKSGDIVYLHFSCHGQPFEDMDGDEADGWDESIVPIDAFILYKKGVYEGQNHLIDDELNTYTDAIREKLGSSGQLIVVIDACYAGTASRGDKEIVTRGTKRGFSSTGKYFRPPKDLKQHYVVPSSPSKAPVVYLEACKSTQVNTEIKRNGKYYGPLSFYIHQVLSNTSLDNNFQWVYQVEQLMNKDIEVNQDMTIEKSN